MGTWAAIVLALAGVALMGNAMFWLLKNDLNGPSFSDVLVKMLRADNRERALKLCNAIGSTSPYFVVARGALELRIPARDPQAGPAADYRSPVAERAFEVRVREALWVLVRGAAQSVDRRVAQSILGCMLLGAAVPLATMRALLSLKSALGVAVLILAIVALNLRKRRKMRRELVHLSEILQPWVLRAED